MGFDVRLVLLFLARRAESEKRAGKRMFLWVCGEYSILQLMHDGLQR